MAALESPPTGRRRKNAPRKGDLRERAILDAAETLLSEQGLDPVTVEQIAGGAGLSRASLYFYFGSKQEVVSALVARTLSLVRDDLDIVAEEAGEPPKTTIERVIRRVEKHWLDHGVVMRAAVENGPLISEVGDLWRETIEAYVDPLAEVLARAGIPDDETPAGARAQAKALCWMGERNFYLASMGDRPKDRIRETAETVILTWWRTMGVDAGP